MQPRGTIDINLTLKAWADIVINRWDAAINSIQVIDKGDLLESLKYTLFINAGSDIEKIEFSFKLYGIFVGALYLKGKVTKKDAENEDWFSKRYFAQVMRLNEILTQKYSTKVGFTLKNILEAENIGSLNAISSKI